MKNKNFSRILGMILSLALICSMITLPMTAEAEVVKVWKEVWSQTFDNLTANDDGTYNLGGASTDALEVDPTGYATADNYDSVTGNKRHAYLTADTKTGLGYALALTHTPSSTASIPVNTTFDGKSTYKITYDWLTNAPNESGKKSRVRFYQESGDHYQVTKSEGKPYLTTYGWGTTSEVPPIGEWVKGEITFNSATKDVTVKWIKSDGTVILNKTGSQWTTFTDISKIELVGELGGQMIDNIVIAKEVKEEVEEPIEEGYEKVWSQNFDNLTANGDGTYTLGGTNTTALEVNPSTYGNDSYPNTRHAYLAANGSGYALTLTHTGWSEADFLISGATISETAGKGIYKITYDWQTNCDSNDSNHSYVRLTGDGGYVDVGGKSRYPYIAGIKGSTKFTRNTWYKVEVVIDFENKTIDYTVCDGNGNVFFELEEPTNASITSLTKIGLLAVAGGQKIDNIEIAKAVDVNYVWSENFDNLTANGDGTYTLGGTNTTALEIDPVSVGTGNSRHAYLATNGSGYALTLTHTGWSEADFSISGATISEIAGNDIYKITYDWQTNCTTTNYSYVRFTGNGGYVDVGVNARKPYIAGTTGTTDINVNTWYKVEVVFDYGNSTIDYTIYDGNGEVFFELDEPISTTLTSLTKIGLLAVAGGQKIDNILITRVLPEAEPEVEIFEKVLDEPAKYVEFEADVYYDGTSSNDIIYAKSGSTQINLFKIGNGYMMLGDSKTSTDTPNGWYNVNMILSYIDNIAIITVTTPEGAVIQRADPRYLESSSIDKLYINLAEENYDNVSIRTEYKETESETNDKKGVLISSVTKRKGDYKLELTHTAWSEATIPVNTTIPETAGQGVYKLTFDWQTQCGKSSSSEKSLVRLANRTKYFEVGAIKRIPVFGTTTGTTAFTKNEWYNVEVILDFENKVADLVIYDLNGDVFFEAQDESIEGLTALTGINLHGIAGGQVIDNIQITKIEDSSIVWSQDFNDIDAITINSYTTSGEAYQPELKINPNVSNTNDTRHVYLSISGNEVLGIEELSEGDSVIINLEFNNITEEEAVYKIIAAYYSNDTMIAVEEVEDVNNYVVLDMTDIDNLTFFTWESLTSFIPLSDKYEISNMKFASDEVYNLVTTFYADEGTTRAFSWSATTDFADMVIQYAEADQNFDKTFVQKDAEYELYEGQLYYKVDIAGLIPGEKYVYRIGDIVDDVWSKEYEFTTEPEDVDEFTFIGLADPQSDVWVGGFAHTYELLNVALEENPETVFTLNLGDMVNNGYDEGQWSNYFKTVEGSGETLPHMAVVGNHETRGDEITAVKNFSLHFNNPKNGANAFGDLTVEDTTSVYGDGIVTNKAETVYSFDYGDAHFVVLNTGTDFSYEDTVTILTEQAKWLANDLELTDKKWKIVMIHQGMYPAKTERYNTKTPLLEVIDKHEVDLVLQGHDHVVARTYPMRNDEIVTKLNLDTITKGTGTVYSILGSSGLKRYDPIVNTPEWFAVLNATNAYQPTYTVYKIDGDSIDVVTKQLNGLVVDEFSIVEKAE